MIELVFVIVILGILSAVAIPKIMATRDDAKVAAMSQSISTAATEVASYAVSSGRVESDMAQMSNAITTMIKQGKASQPDMNVTAVDFQMGDVTDCITMEVDDGVMDANLTVSYGTAWGDRLCENLQSIFDDSKYPIPLTGARVVH